MRAEAITCSLGGRWRGLHGIARCPAHEDRRPSLSLADGDDGRLLAHCFAGCAFDAIVAGLRELGVLDGPDAGVRDREKLARARNTNETRVGKMAAFAQATWRNSLPIAGTLGQTYFEGRGITCELPDTLRFQPEGWYSTSLRLPSIVALVEGGPGFSIQRTYLALDGSGKAAIEPNRKMLGSTTGGAVRLSQAAGPLVAAEGIETALSLLCGLLRGPAGVWTALSANGLAKLALPEEAGQLIVASDGDKVGGEAGRMLAQRAFHLGWRVSLLSAPAAKDWNDVLQEGSRVA